MHPIDQDYSASRGRSTAAFGLPGYSSLIDEVAASRPESPSLEAKNLLLVDDEPSILSALKRLLRRDGYTVRCAGSAEEAFHILAEYPIDVILSDERMPEMNGTDFLAQVKDLYPHTVRLVLSGYTEVESVTEAINKGAIYKFLTKPWDDEQLRANIREAFQRHDIEQQNNRLKMEVEQKNAELVQLNHILEQRVSERNDRIQRDNDFRQVMQELLDTLPVGILGVDQTGDLMLMNRLASEGLNLGAGSLIGCSTESLPEPLSQSINEFLQDLDQEPFTRVLDCECGRVEVSLSAMGVFSKSKGCAVTLKFLN